MGLGMAGEFLAVARESNDKWIEAYGLACVGELKAQLGERAEGVGLLKTALASFETLGSRDECARVLRVLSTAYEAGGNLTEALACLRKAGDIEQRLKSEDTERRARALAARRRLDQASLETERYKQMAPEDSPTGPPNRRPLAPP